MSLPTSSPPPLPGPSPLKQLNASGQPRPISKLEASWQQLASNPHLFDSDSPSTSPSPARYFADFFCLKPQLAVQRAALDNLSVDDLLGPYKNNFSNFFTNAVAVLKNSDRNDVSRTNVIETLIPFLRDILSRKYENYGHSLRTILAGSVEKSDRVFTDLVTTIDLTLQDHLAPLSLRHRTLQLALVIVSTVSQGSLNAYFLRRDLFSTLVSFIANEDTKQFAFESTLLLGLLANFRKSEARNPYGVRIEDFVEEGVMTRIIDVVETVCNTSRDAYIALQDDASPSFVSSLTYFLTSFRITDLLSSPFSLPPPPPSSTSSTPLVPGTPGTPDEKGKGKESAQPSASTSPEITTSPSEPPTTPKKASRPSSPSVSAAKTTPRPTLSRAASTATSRPEDAPFLAMPPEMVAIFLPFYELLNSNKTFGSLVFSPNPSGGPPALPSALISLTSYIVSHASLSPRAQLYSRLALINLLILVEEGEGKLTNEESVEIRLCRQRQPTLSRDSSRRPIAAMIDTVVLFLRHNLRKRLDVETYIVALRLLQRIMQQLKAEKVRLARDWVIVWRSIIALSRFIVSRVAELRTINDKVDTLISQIFITLCYAAYWADSLLPSASDQAHLYYELLHADSVLQSLSDVLGISSIASPIVLSSTSSSANNSSTSLPTFNRRDTPTRATFFATLSPTRSSFGSLAPPTPTYTLPSAGGTGGGFVATECISSLRSATSFFQSHIAQLSLSRRPGSSSSSAASAVSAVVALTISDAEPLEPHEILAVIEKNLGGVEMIESAAMGDLRRFATEGSQGMESYFREIGEVVGRDAARLMELRGDDGMGL